MIRFTEIRLDASTVQDLPDGSIKVRGQLTHTGVFSYRNLDGTARREYRPSEEVFRKESLDTFAAAPITYGHPPEERVTAESWKKYAIGNLGETIRQDGEYAEADLYIRDAAAVRAVKSGEARFLSLGYKVDYDPTPGVAPDGTRFDGVQRNIRGNHLALLPPGIAPRGGESCVLRLDSADDEIPTWLNSNVTPEQIEALKAQITALTGELGKARTDAAEVETLRKDLAAAQALLIPERLDALVEERAAVCAVAKAAGIETKGQSTLAIGRKIIAARTPDLASRVDSYSAETVSAVLASYAGQPHKSLTEVVAVVADASKPGTEQRADKADDNKIPTISELYSQSVEKSLKAWQNPGDYSRQGN